MLGASASFARAEAHEIISWDCITELYYGAIVRDIIAGTYYRIVLQDCNTA